MSASENNPLPPALPAPLPSPPVMNPLPQITLPTIDIVEYTRSITQQLSQNGNNSTMAFSSITITPRYEPIKENERSSGAPRIQDRRDKKPFGEREAETVNEMKTAFKEINRFLGKGIGQNRLTSNALIKLSQFLVKSSTEGEAEFSVFSYQGAKSGVELKVFSGTENLLYQRGWLPEGVYKNQITLATKEGRVAEFKFVSNEGKPLQTSVFAEGYYKSLSIDEVNKIEVRWGAGDPVKIDFANPPRYTNRQAVDVKGVPPRAEKRSEPPKIQGLATQAPNKIPQNRGERPIKTEVTQSISNNALEILKEGIESTTYGILLASSLGAGATISSGLLASFALASGLVFVPIGLILWANSNKMIGLGAEKRLEQVKRAQNLSKGPTGLVLGPVFYSLFGKDVDFEYGIEYGNKIDNALTEKIISFSNPPKYEDPGDEVVNPEMDMELYITTLEYLRAKYPNGCNDELNALARFFLDCTGRTTR